MWHMSIRLQQLVSYTKPVNGFVSVTIGGHLPCIDQGIDFYKGHQAESFYMLQNYYNNVYLTSKRRVVNTPHYNEYACKHY